MARTKQTARKSSGGKMLRAEPAHPEAPAIVEQNVVEREDAAALADHSPDAAGGSSKRGPEAEPARPKTKKAKATKPTADEPKEDDLGKRSREVRLAVTLHP